MEYQNQYNLRNQELKKSPLNSNRYIITSTNFSTKFSSTEENNNNNFNLKNLNNREFQLSDNLIKNIDKNSRNNINEIYDNSDSIGNPTENYINYLKAKFEIQKQILMDEFNEYKRQNENEKNKMNVKLKYLENRIKEIQDKNNLDNQIIIGQYNDNVQKLTEDKDEKIKMLTNKNNELNQMNNQLLIQLNSNLDLLNNANINLGIKVKNLEYENNRLKKEKANLKGYYSQKLENHKKNLEDDKNKLINDYENQLKSINDNYENSKQSLNKLIDERNNDIKRLTDNSKSDIERLSNLNTNYKNEIDKLNKEKINLLKQNEEFKITIEHLNNDLNKKTNESNLLLREKTITDEKVNKLQRQNTNLIDNNEKLNRMSYGRFKKAKKILNK